MSTKNERKRAEMTRARAQGDERRRVVLRVMNTCDEIIEDELARLVAAGTRASCRRGCAHCCRQEIRVPRAEAEVVAAWVRETRSEAEIDALKTRLAAWLAWYRDDYRKLVTNGVSRADAFYEHGPHCPALEKGECSIYPVRPFSCRSHYVSSSPDACRPSNDPSYRGEPWKMLMSITERTSAVVPEVRRLVEAQGADFAASVHLLPEWLAHLLEVERDPWVGSPRIQFE